MNEPSSDVAATAATWGANEAFMVASVISVVASPLIWIASGDHLSLALMAICVGALALLGAIGRRGGTRAVAGALGGICVAWVVVLGSLYLMASSAPL